MFTCFDDYMLLCSPGLMIVWLHVYILGWSYAPMLTWSHAWLIIFLDAYMFDCSNLHLLWWSHAPMFTCLDNRLLPWSNALIITFSHSRMLWWLNAQVLKCIDIHMFNINTHVYSLWWWCVYLFGGFRDPVGRLCAQMFDKCAWMQRSLYDKRYLYFVAQMLICLYANMLVWFYAHMLYTLIFKCSHVQLRLFHKT